MIFYCYQVLHCSIRQEASFHGRYPEVCCYISCFKLYLMLISFLLDWILVNSLWPTNSVYIDFFFGILWLFMWFWRYLIEHPEYQTEGVSMTRFSFQIPKPLREDYVRKRRPNMNASCDASKLESGEGTCFLFVPWPALCLLGVSVREEKKEYWDLGSWRGLFLDLIIWCFSFDYLF